jgi:hypothetical protein
VAAGDYCQTLDLTDVATTGTETMAVRNKAQVWVFEALKVPISVMIQKRNCNCSPSSMQPCGFTLTSFSQL